MNVESKLSDNFRVSARLVELITKMPLGEQYSLLNELEKRSSKLKRKHHRKPIRTIVEYGSRDRLFKDFMQNISVSGVFIENRLPFRSGEDISLCFILPTSPENQVKIDGKIVRISPRGIGVEFNMLNEVTKTLIKFFIEMDLF